MVVSSRDPGHHFNDVFVGEFNTNSCVERSYVEVVSRPLIKVPIHISVINVSVLL